jgi:F-box/WD-40 domain protein MET30
LWDIYSQSKIRTFSGHMGPIQTLSLLEPVHLKGGAHQPRIVTGSLDNTIKIWDFNTGELLRTLFGHADGVWGLGADLIRIVSCSSDRTLKIWDIETGQCIHTIISHDAAINAVWLSETKLISADINGVITVRDFLVILV